MYPLDLLQLYSYSTYWINIQKSRQPCLISNLNVNVLSSIPFNHLNFCCLLAFYNLLLLQWGMCIPGLFRNFIIRQYWIFFHRAFLHLISWLCDLYFSWFIRWITYVDLLILNHPCTSSLKFTWLQRKIFFFWRVFGFGM